MTQATFGWKTTSVNWYGLSIPARCCQEKSIASIFLCIWQVRWLVMSAWKIKYLHTGRVRGTITFFSRRSTADEFRVLFFEGELDCRSPQGLGERRAFWLWPPLMSSRFLLVLIRLRIAKHCSSRQILIWARKFCHR